MNTGSIIYPAATFAEEVAPLAPVLCLVVAGILALLTAAFAGRTPMRRTLLAIGLIGAIGAAVSAAVQWNWSGPSTTIGGMVAADRLAVVGVIVIGVCTAAGLLFGYDYFDGTERSEFTALLLFAGAGMAGLVSSANLIMVFISLEILSLSLYVLCGFTLRAGGGEASLKYFLLGAFSSAFFLYGVAMAYGATGTVSIGGIGDALRGQHPSGIALAAVALLGVGFAFKVAAVPFHMWTPDVYQGAPAPVTAFMAAGTKTAAFIAFLRVFSTSFDQLALLWSDMVMALAVASMVGGAVLAVAQRDVKRLLAYSSVSHAGFILVAVGAGAPAGATSVLFYLAVYSVTVLGAFGVVMVVGGGRDEASGADSFHGLARRQPVVAATLSWFLLSLAGIPPTAGFIAKVGVFGAAVGTDFTAIALVGVLASVIAAYAYLRVIVWMYFDDSAVPSAEVGVPSSSRAGTTLAIAVPVFVILVLGVLPGLLGPVLEKVTW